MSTFTPDRALWNTQRVLTKTWLYLINGHPLCAPEAPETAEQALINPNQKGGES